MDRSTYCGLVRSSHIDKEITLGGWVDRRRDHGGVIFLDLRDREGIVQVVFDSDAGSIDLQPQILVASSLASCENKL